MIALTQKKKEKFGHLIYTVHRDGEELIKAYLAEMVYGEILKTFAVELQISEMRAVREISQSDEYFV